MGLSFWKKYGGFGRFARKTALILGSLAVCWLYILRPVYITGNSMYPSLRDGDLCMVFRAGEYYAGNLVAYETEDKKIRAGRILAAQGQQIDFPESGGYTVDGFQPAEEIVYPTYKSAHAANDYPLTVPENSFFIMNDFRSDDDDSRSFGCISGSRIVGRIVFLLRRRGF